MLIAVCGVDGSGKNTYIERIAKIFLHKNVKCIDPMQCGEAVNLLKSMAKQQGKSIREMYTSTMISNCFALDLLKGINDCYNHCKDQIIISHRYTLCSKVYSKINGSDMQEMQAICDLLPVPDLLIYLSVSVETAQLRIEHRNKQATGKENRETIEKALTLYDLYIKTEPAKKILRLNNNIPIDRIDENIKLIQQNINKEVYGY
jgi:thymidylate kinase